MPRRSQMKNPTRDAQRGATLLISMIFLVIITLMVASAVKVSTLNTKVVGNMQGEQEAEGAAMQAIETTIGTDFTQLPAASTQTMDVGQAGANYTVVVAAPLCTGIKPVKTSELDAENSAADRECLRGTPQPGPDGTVPNAGDSLCSASNWDLSATATAPSGGVNNTATHQGVSVRVAVGADC
mgnify:CR=1 FL=1